MMPYFRSLPPRIKNGKQRLAIDFNLIPDSGKPTAEEAPYIIKSQAKAGTCSFYAYATIYVKRDGKRVTIAITSVRQYDTEVAVITRLLDKISQLNLKIKRLYLDRGFFNVPVIRWLKALDIPFEILKSFVVKKLVLDNYSNSVRVTKRL